MDRDALIHFVGGAIAGTAGTAFTCPLEVIKTRLQSSKALSKIGIFRLVTNIVREEGVRALYKGLITNLFGVAPSK